MPTYEYRCKDCGHEFDTIQAFTDDALTECPVCQGSLKKKFGSVGISFKGSGFYKTDTRSTPVAAKAGAGTSESTGGSSGGDSSNQSGSPSSEGAGGSGAKSSGDQSSGGEGSSGDKSGSTAGDKKPSTTPSATPKQPASAEA